jgi:flagellar assembly protein FliH
MSSDATLRGGRPGVTADLEREAHEALARARAEADALLAEARHEAEVLVRERYADEVARARDEGLEAGRAEGREEALRQAIAAAREDVALAVRRLTDAASALSEATEAARAEAEAGLVRLAAAIGEQLARRSLELDADAARELVSEAIGLVVDRAEVRVLVSPAEHEALSQTRDALREEYPEIVRIAFERDAGVQRGGCRVVTAAATVDASLGSRAEAIATQLLSGRRSA